MSRLWAPLLVFVFAVACAIVLPDLPRLVGGDPSSRAYVTLRYAAQIALWIGSAFLVIRLLDIFFWDRFVVRMVGRSVPRLLKDAVALIIFLFAVAAIVGVVFGESLTGIWATSGVIGIVLGLALRSIILDIFSGLAVNIDESYRIGDWVEVFERGVPNFFGKILEVKWRSTRIELEDKRVVVVPNSRMGLAMLANYSLSDGHVRFEIPIVLDFSVPQARATRVLLAGARAATGLLEEPPPKVLVGGATAVGVEYRVRYWQDVDAISVSTARDQVMRSILRHLDAAGLSLAHPKQDTFYTRMPQRQLEHQSLQDRARLLAQVEILRGIETAQLQRLAAQMQPRQVSAAGRLMRQGDAAQSMFILAEGLLEVWIESDGSSARVAQIAPGEFVGEMSLLADEPRSATVTAATEALVYEITREHLGPILEADPQLFEAISRLVALRRLRTRERLSGQEDVAGSADVQSVAAQILDRMRALFGAFGRRRGEPRAPTEGRRPE